MFDTVVSRDWLTWKLKKVQKVQLPCKRFGSCLEAAEKRSIKGAEGPEKGKGRKPEGEGPVILLMLWRKRVLKVEEWTCAAM